MPGEIRNPVPINCPSVILIEDNTIYTESDAVPEIFVRLDSPWFWIALLRIIARCRVRDACYCFIVLHRHQ
jgi:predicted DCC family thiol-disulfide oxidoreductase YuxK